MAGISSASGAETLKHSERGLPQPLREDPSLARLVEIKDDLVPRLHPRLCSSVGPLFDAIAENCRELERLQPALGELSLMLPSSPVDGSFCAGCIETLGRVTPALHRLGAALEAMRGALDGVDWHSISRGYTGLTPDAHDKIAWLAKTHESVVEDGERLSAGMTRWLLWRSDPGREHSAFFFGRSYPEVAEREIDFALAHLQYVVARLSPNAGQNGARASDASGPTLPSDPSLTKLYSILRRGILRADRVSYECGQLTEAANGQLGGGPKRCAVCAVMLRVLPAGRREQTTSESFYDPACAAGIESNARQRVFEIPALVNRLIGGYGPFSLMGVAAEQSGDPTPQELRKLSSQEIQNRLRRVAIAAVATGYESRSDIEADTAAFRGWDFAFVPSFTALAPQSLESIFIPQELRQEWGDLGATDSRLTSVGYKDEELSVVRSAQALSFLQSPKLDDERREGVIRIPDFAPALEEYLTRLSLSLVRPRIVLLHATRL